jgi:hypothetical protein
LISALSLGERVARVASQVRGFFPQSLATADFGLIGDIFWLRRRVRPIQEECYNLLESLFPDIHCSVHAFARLGPVHFTSNDRRKLSLPTIAKLDTE